MSAGEEAVETVTDLLRALGATKDAVADTLRQAGITGLADDVHRDPIANWLRANGIIRPEVDLEQVALDAYENPDMTDGPFRALLPSPVRAFIVAFEAGDYSDLRVAEVSA